MICVFVFDVLTVELPKLDIGISLAHISKNANRPLLKVPFRVNLHFSQTGMWCIKYAYSASCLNCLPYCELKHQCISETYKFQGQRIGVGCGGWSLLVPNNSTIHFFFQRTRLFFNNEVHQWDISHSLKIRSLLLLKTKWDSIPHFTNLINLFEVQEDASLCGGL